MDKNSFVEEQINNLKTPSDPEGVFVNLHIA